MVSHVFMADVGHSGQILSYADSAWACVGNTCPVCCVARRGDFDLIEVEKPPAFRPLSRTPAQVPYFLFFYFWTFLYFCFVPSSPPRCLPRGSLEQHFRQCSKLGQRGFCM